MKIHVYLNIVYKICLYFEVFNFKFTKINKFDNLIFNGELSISSRRINIIFDF